jgi:hypothetical protein
VVTILNLQVEGIYGKKAGSFPCIPGGEGVAEVKEVSGRSCLCVYITFSRRTFDVFSTF